MTDYLEIAFDRSELDSDVAVITIIRRHRGVPRDVYEIANQYIGEEANKLYRILTERGALKMKFQILDRSGNIVDRDLTYEEALLWTDYSRGHEYQMELMEEDD